eukprot:350077-Chlamydomonas_euryale.AAC.19
MQLQGTCQTSTSHVRPTLVTRVRAYVATSSRMQFCATSAMATSGPCAAACSIAHAPAALMLASLCPMLSTITSAVRGGDRNRAVCRGKQGDSS